MTPHWAEAGTPISLRTLELPHGLSPPRRGPQPRPAQNRRAQAEAARTSGFFKSGAELPSVGFSNELFWVCIQPAPQGLPYLVCWANAKCPVGNGRDWLCATAGCRHLNAISSTRLPWGGSVVAILQVRKWS